MTTSIEGMCKIGEYKIAIPSIPIEPQGGLLFSSILEGALLEKGA